jgi:hypothetical protein
VRLGVAQGSRQWLPIQRDEVSRMQSFAVAMLPPGRYPTACGKGQWACEADEPAFLDLRWPSFEFFRFESASSIFWWDSRSRVFVRTWVSD